MTAKSISPEERIALDQRARSILARNPGVIDLIAEGARANPQGMALVYLRTPDDPQPASIDYDRLMGLLHAAANWFRDAGVEPQDAVSIFTPACPATFVSLWAAMAAARAHPLNLLFTRATVAAQLKAAGSKLLLTPAPGMPGGLYETVAGLDREIPGLRIVTVPLDGAIAFDGRTLEPDKAWRAAAPADPGEADRVAALFPTGGTTGLPKIARLTNRNMVASAIGSALLAGYGPTDRTLCGLPLFHVGAAFVSSLAALSSGAAIYLPTAAGFRNPAVVQNFWKIIEANRITVTGMVPTSIGAVAGVPIAGADITRLRLVAVGAAPCPSEVERRFLAVSGLDALRQVYGMTEFAGAITQVGHGEWSAPGSVGSPVPLVETAILVNGELRKEYGVVGELITRGPQVFAGYLVGEQTKSAFHEGDWLRTGDLAQIDADGQIHILGRVKDLIIRGGHNIDPLMIEEAAMKFPGVAVAAAVGRPDRYSGEAPMLFVSAQPGAAIDQAALLAFVESEISERPALPKVVAVLAEIPLTPVGKIFKPRLRELAAENAARELLGDNAGEIRAAHDDRGLTLRVTVEGGDETAAAARQMLAQFPIRVEVFARQ